jgi:hypothetical protein
VHGYICTPVKGVVAFTHYSIAQRSTGKRGDKNKPTREEEDEEEEEAS